MRLIHCLERASRGSHERSASALWFVRVIILCLALLALQSLCAVEPAKHGFLGWIPVQYVPAGGELALDMHRFLEPAPGDSISLPVPLTKEYQASFDADRLLKVSVDKDAMGLLDIPLEVKNGGKPTCRAGVLTIAVGEPGGLPESPTVFAESQMPGLITFCVSGSSPVTRISAVLERPDGSSSLTPFVQLNGTSVRVPTRSVPDGSWVRIVAADDKGRVSRAVRAQVRPKEGFRWQDGIIYYAFTDRFVNGDQNNDRPVKDPAVLPQANYLGGDFEGIQKKIEEGYFKKIGVNVLWLAPLNRNPDAAWKEFLPPYRAYTGYHGYWPVSESEVEPRFGGEEGLKNLVGSAQKNGIKIIADLVLKHVHIENPLWKEHPDWFGSLTLPDGTKNLRLWDAQQFTTWFE